MNELKKRDMNVRKSVISLLLGVTGGLGAFLATEAFVGREVRTPSRHELVGPGIKQVAYTQESSVVPEEGGRIDLRMAAKKAVPGVVHVKWDGNIRAIRFWGIFSAETCKGVKCR